MSDTETKPKPKAKTKTKTKDQSTDLVKTTNKPVATSEVDQFLISGSTGLENVSSKSIVIPRIAAINSLSPQFRKTKPQYIPEAKLGDIVNTATGELFDSLEVIPAAYNESLIEWKPNMEGFVRSHGKNRGVLNRCEPDGKGNYIITEGDGEGNVVEEHFDWYVIDADLGTKLFISFANTSMKVSRSWMTAVTNQRIVAKDGRACQAPLWANSWKVTTQEISNDKGEWFSLKVTKARSPSELGIDKIKAAVDFHKSVAAGEVEGDLSDGHENAEAAADTM